MNQARIRNLARWGFALLSFFFAAPEAALGQKLYRPGDLPHGLAAWWKLNEPERTSVVATGARIDPSQSVFGGASAFFDGDQDVLTLPDSDNWSFGAQDFTIEFRVRFNSVDRGELFYQALTTTSGYSPVRILSDVVGGEGVMSFYVSSTGSSWQTNQLNVPVTTNRWYSVAFVRKSETLSVFLDGALAASAPFQGSLVDSTSELQIGDYHHLRSFSGWLDEYRISRIARYTGQYSLATSEFTQDEHTVLLLHMNGQNGSQEFSNSVNGIREDSSGNENHLAPGGAVGSTFDDYWQTQENSAEFEASNIEYLTIADGVQAGLDLDGDSFTLAGWVKCRSYAAGGTAVMNKGNWPPTSGYLWRIDEGIGGGGRSQLVINGQNYYGSSGTIPLNRWVHLAIVRDLSSNTISFYADGNLESVTSTTIGMQKSERAFVLGKYSDINDGPFNGLMSDMAVWDVALTPLQIKSLAMGRDLSNEAFRPGNVSVQPTHWWKLNELFADGAIPGHLYSDTAGAVPLSDGGAPNRNRSRGGFIEGSAASFLASNSTFVSAPASPGFDFSGGVYSISCWIRARDLSAHRVIASHATDSGNFWVISADIGGEIRFQYKVGGAQTCNVTTHIARIAAGTWYHLALVQYAPGSWTIYLDGFDRGNNSGGTTMPTFTGNFYLGKTEGNFFGHSWTAIGPSYWDGEIADFAIWKGYALTAKEIDSLAAGLPVQSAGVAGYWKMDEESGTRFDSIGSHNLTTLANLGNATGRAGLAALFIGGERGFLQAQALEGSSLDIHDELTALAWVRPTTIGSAQAFLAREAGYGLSVRASGSLRFSTGIGLADSISQLSTGQWTHAAGVWDNSKRYVYVDGNKEVEGEGASPSQSPNPVMVGGDGRTGEFLDGALDEIIVARRAFRPDEIKAIYNRGLNGLEAFPPSAQVEVAPLVLSFGGVPTNEVGQASLTIRNTNAVPVAVALVTSAPFSVDAAEGFTLATNETRQLLVYFTPSSVGTFSNVLSIAGVTVSLRGEGIPDKTDSDCDGIPDYWERQYGLDPLNALDAQQVPAGDTLTYQAKYSFRLRPDLVDNDADGRADYDEVFVLGTNPHSADSDGDQMSDKWELDHGLNPLLNDASDDLDSDGLSNLDEFRNNLDPSKPASNTSEKGDLEHVAGERRSRFTYDKNDRLVGAEYFSSELLIGYKYDGNGNIVRQLHANSRDFPPGLPVLWRFQNEFPLTDSSAANALFADADGDGWSNYQEWKGGTDPRSAASVPTNAPQSAPIARVLPQANPSGSLVPVALRVWDAEGNPSAVLLQYRAACSSNWVDAGILAIDGQPYRPTWMADALPSGIDHALVWNVASVFTGGGRTNFFLRAMAKDNSLTGGWSEEVQYTVISGLPPGPDTEPDGLPDAWELQYSNDLNDLTAAGDYDGDGFSDVHEYRADTDPKNAVSNLHFIAASRTTSGLRLEWASGTNAWQILQRSPALGNNADWTDVYVVAPPSSGTEAFVDQEISETKNYFYRLEARR